MSSSVLFEMRESVAIITLNRPDVLNSFTEEMSSRLKECLESVRAQDSIRAAVLTGSGRGFCAGQDLASVDPSHLNLGAVVRSLYNPVVRLIRNTEKPILCAVNGVAAGAGANIALCCDIVVAAESASFIQSFSAIGLIPDSGGTFILPRLVGFGRASALALLGEKLSAPEALKLGLIYRTAAADTVLAETIQLAHRLTQRPPTGLGATKLAFNRAVFPDLEEQLEKEATLQEQCGKTEDFQEGIRAFLEKRAPIFRGR